MKYSYFFSLTKAVGKVGDEFDLILYYSNTNPGISNLKIIFGDTPRPSILNAEVFDISVSGAIYGTRVKISVPFGFSPGKYKIRVLSAYDEEFLSNNPIFEVTP